LLRTERLVLRRPRLEDADAVAGLLGDPEVMRFLGGETVPRDDVRIVVQRWLDDWETYPLGKFIVERREDRVVVGRVGLNYFDRRTWARSAAPDAVPELGWALARTHWGCGYATEAALAVRELVGRERLISLIAEGNIRSQAVAGRLGATPTETVTLWEGSKAVVWVHPR
jgi:RimJ/RimL family protein N-acetyltransferase